MLIHYGHGGVGPEGMWGSMTHAETVTMFQNAGLAVTHSDSWPASLAEFRLVILPAPGFNDAAAVFTSGEVAQLSTFLAGGGLVVIEGENSAVMGYDVINPLLEGVGASMRLQSGWFGGNAQNITGHALTAGVQEVGLALSANLVLASDGCLAAVNQDCAVGVHAAGSGYLVLAGDGNMWSDLGTWDNSNLDNRQLLRNMAKLSAPTDGGL